MHFFSSNIWKKKKKKISMQLFLHFTFYLYFFLWWSLLIYPEFSNLTHLRKSTKANFILYVQNAITNAKNKCYAMHPTELPYFTAYPSSPPSRDSIGQYSNTGSCTLYCRQYPGNWIPRTKELPRFISDSRVTAVSTLCRSHFGTWKLKKMRENRQKTFYAVLNTL